MVYSIYLVDVIYSNSIGASALRNAYTNGNLHAHINDLSCTGNENSLWDCLQNTLTDYTCSNYDDASVICQCKIFIFALNVHLIVNDVVYSNCTTGDIRLTDGPSEYEGRVEICMNGVWGSVCDYGWDTSEATTICKQLGYGGENCVFVNMIFIYI